MKASTTSPCCERSDTTKVASRNSFDSSAGSFVSRKERLKPTSADLHEERALSDQFVPATAAAPSRDGANAVVECGVSTRCASTGQGDTTGLPAGKTSRDSSRRNTDDYEVEKGGENRHPKFSSEASFLRRGSQAVDVGPADPPEFVLSCLRPAPVRNLSPLSDDGHGRVDVNTTTMLAPSLSASDDKISGASPSLRSDQLPVTTHGQLGSHRSQSELSARWMGLRGGSDNRAAAQPDTLVARSQMATVDDLEISHSKTLPSPSGSSKGLQSIGIDSCPRLVPNGDDVLRQDNCAGATIAAASPKERMEREAVVRAQPCGSPAGAPEALNSGKPAQSLPPEDSSLAPGRRESGASLCSGVSVSSSSSFEGVSESRVSRTSAVATKKMLPGGIRGEVTSFLESGLRPSSSGGRSFATISSSTSRTAEESHGVRVDESEFEIRIIGTRRSSDFSDACGSEWSTCGGVKPALRVSKSSSRAASVRNDTGNSSPHQKQRGSSLSTPCPNAGRGEGRLAASPDGYRPTRRRLSMHELDGENARPGVFSSGGIGTEEGCDSNTTHTSDFSASQTVEPDPAHVTRARGHHSSYEAKSKSAVLPQDSSPRFSVRLGRVAAERQSKRFFRKLRGVPNTCNAMNDKPRKARALHNNRSSQIWATRDISRPNPRGVASERFTSSAGSLSRCESGGDLGNTSSSTTRRVFTPHCHSATSKTGAIRLRRLRAILGASRGNKQRIQTHVVDLSSLRSSSAVALSTTQSETGNTNGALEESEGRLAALPAFQFKGSLWRKQQREWIHGVSFV